MRQIVLLLTCLVALPMGVDADELFRWVDESGKVHYGDAPPASAVEIERKKLSNGVEQNEDLPYETRRAQQNFPVTLYVGSDCGEPCNKARSLLSKRGIPFSEKLLKYQEDIDAFRKLSGFTGVPALSVGKNYLRGFLESQWHSELDIAGYPKTATYRQRIAPPAPPESEMPPAEEIQVAPAEPVAE